MGVGVDRSPYLPRMRWFEVATTFVPVRWSHEDYEDVRASVGG